MPKRYLPEHLWYFLLFVIVSVFYNVYGYAALGTNDDWALRGLLTAKGVYGTLIMSYPLSYLLSHLYDVIPAFPWYSTLLAAVMAVNFYLISRYIAKNDSYLQKAGLLVLALLWMTYLWFNMNITTMTIVTVISAIGLVRERLLISFALLFLAFLLRSDMMIIFLPYYLVSFFILREQLRLKPKEIAAAVMLVFLIGTSLWIQKQDRPYMEWLAFNKARSAIVDMGILDVKEGYFSKEERFCISVGWLQDPELLPTEKVIATTPTLKRIIQKNVERIDLEHFVMHYKFRHWLWLLFAMSALLMLLNLKNRRVFFVPALVGGVVLLLLTRDVERVTVPLFMLWAFVVFERARAHRIRPLNTLFLMLFAGIFYYYASGQLTYRYFKENTALQKEARQLIAKSGKVCESSIHYPSRYHPEVTTVFTANYLFRENSWLQMNDREILPGGWLVRHPYFYEAYHMSDARTKRKYPSYHAFMIDDATAFFGGKGLVKNKYFDTLLHAYDKRYLADRPECRHQTFSVASSKHFEISQMRIVCQKDQQEVANEK